MAAATPNKRLFSDTLGDGAPAASLVAARKAGRTKKQLPGPVYNVPVRPGPKCGPLGSPMRPAPKCGPLGSPMRPPRMGGPLGGPVRPAPMGGPRGSPVRPPLAVPVRPAPMAGPPVFEVVPMSPAPVPQVTPIVVQTPAILKAPARQVRAAAKAPTAPKAAAPTAVDPTETAAKSAPSSSKLAPSVAKAAEPKSMPRAQKQAYLPGSSQDCAALLKFLRRKAKDAAKLLEVADLDAPDIDKWTELSAADVVLDGEWKSVACPARIGVLLDAESIASRRESLTIAREAWVKELGSKVGLLDIGRLRVRHKVLTFFEKAVAAQHAVLTQASMEPPEPFDTLLDELFPSLKN